MIGVVTEMRSEYVSGFPVTMYTVATNGGSFREVLLPGGLDIDGSIVSVVGTPVLPVGVEVLLLTEPRDDYTQLASLAQGTWLNVDGFAYNGASAGLPDDRLVLWTEFITDVQVRHTAARDAVFSSANEEGR